MKIHYFAFGSNLSSQRLLERIPRASKHCVATLPGHRLCWHKMGQDLSGKCDIAISEDPRDIVYGVVYQMTHADRLELDIYEGAGTGYERRQISVTALHGETLDAFTYYALEIDRRRKPYHWYKEHVVRGALEHEFPSHYVEQLEATASIDDRDADRHFQELSIYLEQQ